MPGRGAVKVYVPVDPGATSVVYDCPVTLDVNTGSMLWPATISETGSAVSGPRPSGSGSSFLRVMDRLAPGGTSNCGPGSDTGGRLAQVGSGPQSAKPQMVTTSPSGIVTVPLAARR